MKYLRVTVGTKFHVYGGFRSPKVLREGIQMSLRSPEKHMVYILVQFHLTFTHYLRENNGKVTIELVVNYDESISYT